MNITGSERTHWRKTLRIAGAPIAALLLAAGAPGAGAAGFVALSGSGASVLSTCNPNNSASNTNCKVTSLPGEDGYALTASRSAPIIINDITVGTLYEKVWRHCTDRNLYIFGTRIVMNGEAWDESATPFAVSDLFRRALPGKAVAVAYHLDGASTALKVSGRTLQGRGEYDTAQPDRDNSWVAGRVSAVGGGTAGAARSPWVLVKSKAPTGIATDPFAIRALNSAATDLTEIYTLGYQPNGLPSGGDED